MVCSNFQKNWSSIISSNSSLSAEQYRGSGNLIKMESHSCDEVDGGMPVSTISNLECSPSIVV